MKFSEKTYDTIEAYIGGSLNPLDRKAFEKRMRENPELAQEVELYRQMVDQTNELWRDRVNTIEAYLKGTLDPNERESFEQQIESNPRRKEELDLYERMFHKKGNIKEDRVPFLIEDVLAEYKEEETIQIEAEPGKGGKILQPFWRRREIYAIAASVLALVLLIPLKNLFGPQHEVPSGRSQDDLFALAKERVVVANIDPTYTLYDLLDLKRISLDSAERVAAAWVESEPDKGDNWLVHGLLLVKQGKFEHAYQQWNHVYQGPNFDCVERYEIGTYLFWTLYDQKDKSRLQVFKQDWGEIADCRVFDKWQGKRKEELTEIQWVLAHLDELSWK